MYFLPIDLLTHIAYLLVYDNFENHASLKLHISMPYEIYKFQVQQVVRWTIIFMK